MYSSIAKNKRNTVVIFTLFIAIISAIGLYFSWVFNNPSIFTWTLVGTLIYTGVEYFFASRIALYISGAKEITRSQAPEFYSTVDAISLAAGIPMPKVYVINDPSPNAFAAGNSPDKSIICATTGLLDIMNKTELEAIVAHEVSHIKNYDVRVSMAAIALTAAIEVLGDIAWRIILFADDDETANPLVKLITTILRLLTPFLTIIIRMAISREREYLADASAVMLTRYPDGLVSALEKLQKFSRPLKKQSSVTASLFITNPLKSNFLNNLFSTHPPIEKRINRIKENSERF